MPLGGETKLFYTTNGALFPLQEVDGANTISWRGKSLAQVSCAPECLMGRGEEIHSAANVGSIQAAD